MVFAFFSVECSKIDSQTQKCNSNLDCATNEKYPYCLNGYCNVNPKSITRVHLVFMDDLKVGFTDLSDEVLNEYYYDYFPSVMDTVDQLSQEGKAFIYTTHPWLVYKYLTEATNQAQKNRFIELIHKGNITWHAFPFNFESELLDPFLFLWSLSLSSILTSQFNLTPITTASQASIPGLTIGIVPLFVYSNIKALHVGFDPYSCFPEVPRVGFWKTFSNSSDGVITLFNVSPGGNGGIFTVSGCTDALFFGYKGTNDGLWTKQIVLDFFTQAQATFPNAVPHSSTLDSFIHQLEPIKSELPVIQEEIGDPWIYGAASDPAKIAHLRELSRIREIYLKHLYEPDDAKWILFNINLIKVAEQAWGLDEATYLRDYTNWSNQQFEKARILPDFQDCQNSWGDQRKYIYQAISSLRNDTIENEIYQQLTVALFPVLPSLNNFIQIKNFSQTFNCSNYIIQFNSTNGAIQHLINLNDSITWADSKHPLARFLYQTFDESDYDTYIKQYLTNPTQEVIQRFSKVGVHLANPVSQIWEPTLNSLWIKRDKNNQCEFVSQLLFPQNLIDNYGAPKETWVSFTFSSTIQISFQWFGKTLTRLPESFWVQFNPIVPDPIQGWKMDKLGFLIDPFNVVSGGSKHLHAVNEGVGYFEKGHSESLIYLETLDSPLVSPGAPSLLRFNRNQPDLREGWFFNLFNNVWNTNFIMYYNQDLKSRFRIHFKIQK